MASSYALVYYGHGQMGLSAAVVSCDEEPSVRLNRESNGGSIGVLQVSQLFSGHVVPVDFEIVESHAVQHLLVQAAVSL